MPQGVQQIAKSYLKPSYVSVAVGEIGGACTDVVQTFIQVEHFSKKNVLINLLKDTGKLKTQYTIILVTFICSHFLSFAYCYTMLVLTYVGIQII